jgi:hypothetical protein
MKISKISKVNRIYADGYIKNNIRFYGMFKFKLLVCKVFLSPITIFIKKNKNKNKNKNKTNKQTNKQTPPPHRLNQKVL